MELKSGDVQTSALLLPEKNDRGRFSGGETCIPSAAVGLIGMLIRERGRL